MNILSELKRRNVLRVAAAYIVLSWLLLQVVDVVAPMLNLPDWFGRGVLLMLALGFIPTLLFSWVYEITPEGIKRESEVDRSRSITADTARRLDITVIVLLVLAIALFVTERFVFRAPDTPSTVATGTTDAESPDLGTESPPAAADAVDSDERASVAVLPFANRSNREEDLFFTDGIHDDLLTQLSKIGSLKVISRTSVTPYRGTDKSLPVIARELGVTNVVEGGIQRAGDQVRINVQLIDAFTDEHLWAETFDRELTAENLFAIQSEISERIADALHAQLSPEEAARLKRVPTDNLDAYQAYLLGQDFFQRRIEGGGPPVLRQAIAQFIRAIELEPDYAEAYGGLAATYAVLNGYLEKMDPEADEKARRNAEKALSLNPELAQAYAVLGLYYRRTNDILAGEENLLRAIEKAPSDANIHLWLGIHYHVAGNLDRGHEWILSARELNPTSGIVLSWLGGSSDLVGDQSEAIRWQQASFDRGVGPDIMLVANFKLRSGDIAGAIADIESYLPADKAKRWVDSVVPAYQDPSKREEAIEVIVDSAEDLQYAHNRITYLVTLGAGEEALDIVEERIDSETDLIVHAWRRDFPAMRRSPRFKAIVEYRGLPEYWRARGWPEFCRPVGDDDFECL